ncbi:MAG: 30S ribosomal protein S13 [Rickettsiales bacterium]|nr:MAG: 30S ribosomal protein S13 [Rickettsiales bacterium]
MVVRIAGVNVPLNKRFVIALTYVYGIGRSRAENICKELGIDQKLRTPEVDEETLTKVRNLITKQAEGDSDSDGSQVLLIEGDLRRKHQSAVKRLIDLGCYKGIRHVKKLPVRGQRTHSNGRTKKGKAVAIAGKKIVVGKKG